MKKNNIDKFILALKDIAIEYKLSSPDDIANEINNSIDNYYLGDREVNIDNSLGIKSIESGVKDNIGKMHQILNSLHNTFYLKWR